MFPANSIIPTGQLDRNKFAVGDPTPHRFWRDPIFAGDISNREGAISHAAPVSCFSLSKSRLRTAWRWQRLFLEDPYLSRHRDRLRFRVRYGVRNVLPVTDNIGERFPGSTSTSRSQPSSFP